MNPLRLVCVCMTALLLAACARPEPPPAPIRAVRTLTVGTSQANVAHDYAAEIRSRSESRLGFRVAGKLLSREVNLGDRVRAGQVLARLDGQDLRLGADAARAGVNAAQVQFDLAMADLRRYRELHQQGFIGAAELDRREAGVRSAQSQLDQAKAQWSVQGNQAAYATLVADAAGVVTAVEAEPGQVLAAGTPVVRMAYDGPRDAVFSVPEDRATAFRALAGQRGMLRLQLWGQDAEVPVVVREVAAAADPVTRTYQVKADVGAAAVSLGQTATVRVAGAAGDAVVRLPLTAVVEAKGRSVVWLLDPVAMTVRQQPVKVGGADGNLVVIASGLKPGDQVVTAGTHVLNLGQKVRRYAEPGVAAPPAASMPAAS